MRKINGATRNYLLVDCNGALCEEPIRKVLQIGISGRDCAIEIEAEGQLQLRPCERGDVKENGTSPEVLREPTASLANLRIFFA